MTLACAAGDRAAAEAEIAEIVRWRRENQPGGQNAGSVFVNPVPGEVSAGLLIDGLGLRGLRIGTAWVSEKHANFIQAADGGSADDVRAVIELVRATGRRRHRVSNCAARSAWSGSRTRRERRSERRPAGAGTRVECDDDAAGAAPEADGRERAKRASDQPAPERYGATAMGPAQLPSRTGASKPTTRRRRRRRRRCSMQLHAAAGTDEDRPVEVETWRRRSTSNRSCRSRRDDRSEGLDVKRSVRLVADDKRAAKLAKQERKAAKQGSTSNAQARRRGVRASLDDGGESVPRHRARRSRGRTVTTRPARSAGPDAADLAGELGSGASATAVAESGGDAPIDRVHRRPWPGTGEIVAIDVATSAARMEPRMRERRIAVRRAVGPQAAEVGGDRAGRRRPSSSPAWPCSARACSPITAVEVEGAVYSRGSTLDAVVDELRGTPTCCASTPKPPSAGSKRSRGSTTPGSRPTSRTGRGSRSASGGRSSPTKATDGRFRVLDSKRSRARRHRRATGRLPRARRSTTAPTLEAGDLAPAGYRAAAIARFHAHAADATAGDIGVGRSECDRIVI